MLIARFISLAEKLCHLQEIQVRVAPDGSFTVTNQRNGFSKTYGAAPGS